LRPAADANSVRHLIGGVEDHFLAFCEALQNLHFCFIPVADLDSSQFCAPVLDYLDAPSLDPAGRIQGKIGPQPNPFILPLRFDSSGSTMLAVEVKG
jgi:hypothetical protein